MLSIVPLLNKLNKVIINPLIVLLFAIGTLMFFWGVFQFVSNAEGEKGREEGKRNMIWGLVGMFIMVSVYGIIRVILDTFGIDAPGYIPV